MTLSVIIPTYNEEATIGSTLDHLRKQAKRPDRSEVIVVDGGSEDKTREKAEERGARCVSVKKRGRAIQMNSGAYLARNGVLYFLHADSRPPLHFDEFILNAVNRGERVGCFRMRFDSDHPLLRISAWFTRLNLIFCRGGDQSLFMARELFTRIGGFDERFLIMEDIDIIQRARKHSPFHVIPREILTSARRYERNGFYRLQFIFSLIHLFYWMGCSGDFLYRFYLKRVR